MYYTQQPTAKLHHPEVNGERGVGGWGRGPNPFQPMPFGLPPPHMQQQHPHHPSFGANLHLSQQGSGGLQIPSGGGQGGYGQIGIYQGGGQGSGSPPRNVEASVPMTAQWQQQLLKAEASRVLNSPHHRARTAAVASRMSNKPSGVIIISDPNRSTSTNGIANGFQKKNTSTTLSVTLNAYERAISPPPSDGGSVPGIPSIDRATPAVAPVPADEDDKPNEPWGGLDLGGIKLRRLSPALFAFNHITSLYINHNALTSLPPAISNLRQLTILDATGNELSDIPIELGVLYKLKELLLFDNHLTNLPYEIGTLFNLETLGIEGNPMDEVLRRLLAEKGTTALIQYLRDEAPDGVYPKPPEREWVEVDPDLNSEASGKQEGVTVLTYNILCQTFAPGLSYSFTPQWALAWDYRKESILAQLSTAQADVVCLQEIDVEQYQDYFLPALQNLGYEGAHYPRTRARTMGVKEKMTVDGCATFWKADKFDRISEQVIDFNQVALRDLDVRTDDMFNRVMARDNIAVFVQLEFRASGAKLLVANSHILWDHRYRDVKLIQIGMLMEELEKAAETFASQPTRTEVDPEYNHGQATTYNPSDKGRDIPLILCVDSNSWPGSAVHDLLSSGAIPPDHPDFMQYTYGRYTAKGIKHHLGLKSACASFGEMKMTNFTPTFVAAIDYIFYSTRGLKVTSVLGDVDKAYLDKTVGFPNNFFPSDHIPVYAQFRVKGTN